MDYPDGDRINQRKVDAKLIAIGKRLWRAITPAHEPG
jgi:hypothetical protein